MEKYEEISTCEASLDIRMEKNTENISNTRRERENAPEMRQPRKRKKNNHKVNTYECEYREKWVKSGAQ